VTDTQDATQPKSTKQSYNLIKTIGYNYKDQFAVSIIQKQGRYIIGVRGNYTKILRRCSYYFDYQMNQPRTIENVVNPNILKHMKTDESVRQPVKNVEIS
jgi:hypothetical protein